VEKGGLQTALEGGKVTQATQLYWGDEMRLGLLGQVRRRWSPRGMKLRQRVQFGRVWRYLALAVDGINGQLQWSWIANMKGESIAAAVQAWKDKDVEAVVWDRAGGHRTKVVREMGVVLVEQPAGSPELNPAERVFEELRRGIEGRLYETIEDKVAAIEAELVALAADAARVRSLAGWSWIMNAHLALPLNTAST
jgi:DDE superfamily endonuclease